MPSEVTHKHGFSIMKYLGWLVAMWIFGYLVGISHAASAEPPTSPEPSRTVQITPEP